MKFLIFILFLALLSSCLKEDDLNKAYAGFQPKNIGDRLQISDPESEDIDPDKLGLAYKKAYSDPDLWPLRSLLVFRNDKLVAEAYLKDDEDILTPHLIWSSTKQVMGILTGIALEEGVITSLKSSIAEYLPEVSQYYTDKADITIEHLITMRSGIKFNNDGIGGDTDKILRQIPDNITHYILSRPLQTAPGTNYHYKDGDPQLLSAVIQSSTGKPVDDWADEVFFSRIGMRRYNWIRYKDGTTMGGFGIESTPRELGKIGLCIANMGIYGGKQVVSSEWIKEMTSFKTDTDLDYKFGYYWWIDPSRQIHFTWGHGGQFVFIVPEESLVIVMTSIPNTQGPYQVDADEAMRIVDLITDACN